MTTPKTKKLMRRRQRGPLQRRNARRDVTSRSTPGRLRSASDSAVSPGDTSATGGTATRRASSPAALTRSQGTRTLIPGRSDARRARANAISKPSLAAPATPKRAILKRQNAMRDRSPVPPKTASPGKPKKDLATGRTLFPYERDGKIQYLPIDREATALERRNGDFVSRDSIRQDAVNKLVDPATGERLSVRDWNSDRTLFATDAADRTREYLPKDSDATAEELRRGKFVPDAQVEVAAKGNTVLKQPPVFNFTEQRLLFATKTADGKREYLPKKDDANALELSQGLYVDDDDVKAVEPALLGIESALSNKPSRYDIGKGRKVFAVNAPDGKTIYLPMANDASTLEKAKGLFIPDEVVERHKSQRRRTALRDDAADRAQRRAQRAAKLLPASVTQPNPNPLPAPVRKAKDGTPLWDGASPPNVSAAKQREFLANLRPKYDLGKGRRVYPTETAQGKIEYLPLPEDASSSERLRGLYAVFVPPEPLEEFLAHAETQSRITRQRFESDRGNVQAFAQDDIDALFEQAPKLVLRSARLVGDSAAAAPALQQQFA